jgi:dethiobiotin synthetase
MAQGWFITGTDTGVGKTLVGRTLLRELARAGQRVVGMKPVASGCDPTPAGLRSADAVALRAAGSVDADYADVNPYAFVPATAPHLAAAEAGVTIDPETIARSYRRLATRADTVIVEGVGGWLAPIDAERTMADVAQLLDLPVILVVAMKLGAINHALLTVEAIAARRCRLAAWVANHADGPAPNRYLEALTARLAAPCLGVIPPDATMHDAGAHLSRGMQTVITGKPES